MKISQRLRRTAVLAPILTIAAMFLTAYDAIPLTMGPNMTALSPRLQPLFERTKTVCFGQFVVEVPFTAIVVFGPTEVDFPITYLRGEREKLDEYVIGRLTEVEKDRKFLSKADIIDFPLFGKVLNGILPGQKLVFGSKDQASYTVESFIPIGKDLFVQHARSPISTNNAIKSLNDTARLLRLRTESEVPTEPGVCVDGGFVAWQPEFERASIGVRLQEFPDVHFSIEVSRNQDYLIDSSALEPRLEQAAKEGGSWYSRVKFFRRGPRQLGNWAGFEALARKPAQEKSTESHEFAFISLGAIRDSLLPELDIKLDTGVKDDQTASVKPSITDEEAVALWDKLTASIRVRPTAPKDATPAKTPLGQYIDTGSACPQTGVWQCNDSREIASARRRHVVAGEPMPHATLLGQPSFWQMLTRQRSTHQLRTIWELVAYDSPSPADSGPAADPSRDS